ncbi:MAG: hypothetical protein US57_C0016G0031 [Candidatus Moranbacteria bacterium GW2011_GWC2_37_73]|nr:MAG: hypothetical protein UR95_C0002G0014 [Parcubacteria group bacterium GW2011_GWC1_36_108]KKQ00216.1 MAG: hypothetical protein US09_C0017G0003 [Candidatus Moranbacteria bacterium GW2011_GWD1_36_198]KKQ00341.1 MAG: hypothetical protein US10_C0034G0011 [Candidatus Moranbacteria bacterium GW2011_GWD2_36_198]KKQ39276.1 MAG: hypothetical protein US57_C0016G0031 [Candidatus Moranbacteria bacterium GW2011_GWC2_37_73]HAR99595.1 hypothetical protein [Candidatus Moranbacteria bacterium]
MAKKISEVVNNCYECPNHWFEEDQDPMGQNGWQRCKKLPGVYLGNSKTVETTIHEKCPLKNA